jgi:hypothetical protein
MLGLLTPAEVSSNFMTSLPEVVGLVSTSVA